MTDRPRIDLEADFPTDFDAVFADASTSEETGAEAAAAPELVSAVEEPRGDASPVVVIEYRNRGIPPVLMFPMALVVSLMMFGAYHYLVARPKNQEIRMAAIRAGEVAAGLAPKRDVAVDDSKPTSGPLNGLHLPLTLESQPLPPGFQPPSPTFAAPSLPPEPKTKTDGAEAAPENKVAETPPPKPPLAVGFARPDDTPPAPPAEAEPKADDDAPKAAAEVALAPKPDILADPPGHAADEPPPPTRDEMIRAIRDEAQAKADEKEEMLRRKEEARARVEAEAQQRVEDERTTFRRALYDIVTIGGPDAGRQIDDLCNQFGRNYSDEIRNRVTAYLSRVHGRISRDAEIRLLRALGVPEPGILDFLANGVKTSLNSRNGPRNPDEVRVTAAKQLLRSKPTFTEADAARASSAMPRYPGR